MERGRLCFSDPVYPDDGGLELLPYTGDDCLTYEGEINKMAVNIAFGRYVLVQKGLFQSGYVQQLFYSSGSGSDSTNGA